MADLFANNLVYQKLIKKYEHTPTPSQPKNNKTKLSEQTKIAINTVNKERVPIKRIKWGSVPYVQKKKQNKL